MLVIILTYVSCVNRLLQIFLTYVSIFLQGGDNMEFKDFLLKQMKKLDIKAADLCRTTGIQSSLMSAYVSGSKSPGLSNAKLIADALGVSLDELSGRGSPDSLLLSGEEIDMIKKFQIIDKSDQDCVRIIINLKYEQKMIAISPSRTG